MTRRFFFINLITNRQKINLLNFVKSKQKSKKTKKKQKKQK